MTMLRPSPSRISIHRFGFLVSALLSQVSPDISIDAMLFRHVDGVSSGPRHTSCSRPPARPTQKNNQSIHWIKIIPKKIRVSCAEGSTFDIAPSMLSLRDSTLGDWGLRAEHLGRSLDAYTPAPLTPSSMGALVLARTDLSPDLPIIIVGWIGCLFSGEVSGLDAFSPYPR
jgi:hypothetical protein